jgi:hypothetical protein
MSDDLRTLYYMIAALLVVASAALVYLDWRKQGEIEYLHARIDAIDTRPIARILRAHDDATAEAVARGTV